MLKNRAEQPDCSGFKTEIQLNQPAHRDQQKVGLSVQAASSTVNQLRLPLRIWRTRRRDNTLSCRQWLLLNSIDQVVAAVSSGYQMVFSY